MAKSTKSRSLAYLALLGNALLWGLATPIVKKGYSQGLDPYLFLFGRMFVAFLFSLPLIAILKRSPGFAKSFTPKNLIKTIPLEILGTVITLVLLYEGLRLTTAVEASLITMALPIFITIGGLIFLKEIITTKEWFGLALALLGTFLLVIKPLLTQEINGDTLGNLLVLIQNLTAAAYYLLAKKHYQNQNKLAITHISFIIGSICFLVPLLVFNPAPISSMLALFSLTQPWPLLAILYMAIPGSILGLTLYLYGQDKIEASEASLFTYLQPAFAIPASILLLSESISLLELLATGVIITGVIIAEKH